jgi:low affinity Fe/Cu permease
MRRFFANLASRSSYLMGHPAAFIIAVAACLIWAVTGPLFDYSDTRQLVINTATTVLTFLAVFLIQNSQNRRRRGNPGKARRSVDRHQPGPDRTCRH